MTEYREHKIAALVGPKGEISVWTDGSDPDWGCLYDCTEDWADNDQDIRRATITVKVPILGPSAPLEIDAGKVEVGE